MGEISVPLQGYVTQRAADLAALPSPTKAEKSEAKLLKGLAKKLAKPSVVLKQDFAELKAAAAVLDRLGAAAAPMQPSFDEGVVRANLSLSERVELVGDYLLVLSDPSHRASVTKALAAVTSARGSAAAATGVKQLAGFLAKADAAVTKTLKKADKYVLGDFDVTAVPPTRFRSGDSITSSGGRVAVPRDSASPVAGASVVIPSGLFQNPLTVTIESAPSFVGGRDVAAGPALAVGPDGTQFPSGVTLHVPYVLPGGTSATDLALAAKGPPQTTVLPVTPGADGTLAASVTKLSTFQALIPAPPLGQPGGAYHLQMFLVNTALDPSDTDAGGLLAGFQDRTATFRADHTGSMSAPVFAGFSRTFVSAPPHHQDAAQTPLDGSVETTWSSGGSGRFTVHFTLAGRSADAMGVVTEEGRVLAFAGRGEAFEFFGVGLRGETDVVLADLEGRFAGAEFGVEFRNDAAEPFTTRWFDAFRTFTADGAGAIAFDAGGTRIESDVTYATDQQTPAHGRVENVAADSGSETWNLLPSGRIGNTTATRSGWFDRESGFLVSTSYESAAHRLSFLVAVRQPATSTPASIPGVFQFAGLDIGTTVGAPVTSSTHDATPLSGSLDVQSVSAATFAADAAARSVYTLSGTAPLADMTWSLTSSSVPLPSASTPLTLVLDAAGNHREAADERWFAFSGDGRIVLSVTRGEAARLARGIAVGVK